MSWSRFALALLVVTLAQTAVIPLTGLGAMVDLFTVLALVVAMTAPMHDARIAAWIVGLVYGAATIGSVGAHALALGLAGWLLTLLRGTLNVAAAPGRVVASFLAAWPALLLIRLHLRYWELGAGESLIAVLVNSCGLAVTASVLAALITFFPGLGPRRGRRERRVLG